MNNIKFSIKKIKVKPLLVRGTLTQREVGKYLRHLEARKKEIRLLMLAKDITQREIARTLKLSPAVVNNVISGRTYSKRIEQEIARRLGRSRKSLFGR